MKIKKMLVSLVCAFSLTMAFNFSVSAKPSSKVTRQEVLNKREGLKNFENKNKKITYKTFIPLKEVIKVFEKDGSYKKLIKEVFLKNNKNAKNYTKKDIEKFRELFEKKLKEIYGPLFNEKIKKEYNVWLKKATKSWKNVGATAPNKELEKLTKEQRKKIVEQEVKEMEKELNYYFGKEFVTYFFGIKNKNLEKEIRALKLVEALKVLDILIKREKEAKDVLKNMDVNKILKSML